MIVKAVVAAFLAIGLYQLFGVSTRFPSRKAVKAIDQLTGEKMSFSDRIILPIAHRIEPHVKLSEYKRNKLDQELKAAGEKITPELHVAIALTASGLLILSGLVILPTVPIVSAGIAIYSIRTYFKLRRVVENDSRRVTIEAEAPRMTWSILQSLQRKQDVPTMLSNYREVSGPELRSELDFLITDMKTKNHEAALIEFESRLNSPLMSELIRTLIGIDQGQDMHVQLQNVAIRMDEHEKAELKKEALQRPDKLGPANWVLLGSMMLNILVIFGTQIVQNINIFGR